MPNLKLWTAPNNHRVYVWADDEKFYAEILAGQAETYLCVGSSDPNGGIHGVTNDEFLVIRSMIQHALDKYWLSEDREMPLDEMMPTLFEMSQIANAEYNKFLAYDARR